MASYSPLQRRHNPDEPQDDDVIDLRQLWLALVRHKWGILALPVLVGMLTFLYVSTLTPIYQGQSTLLIEPDTDNVVGIRGVETGTGEGYLQDPVRAVALPGPGGAGGHRAGSAQSSGVRSRAAG